jgi:alanine racemase
MNPLDAYSTWAEVDLAAIQSNVKLLAERAGARVMAVVKADGYGHGALPAARAALRGGATWCAVARVEEALELRQGEIPAPILILGWVPPARIRELAAARISITVWEASQIEAATAAAGSGAPVHLHLKIDTGMGRLGAPPERAVELARLIKGRPGLVLEGVFTHFARADEPSAPTTAAQERSFREVVESLQAAGLRPELAHAANSAATLTRPEAAFDLVRTGIAVYGLDPSDECRLPSSFRPALAWKTQLAQVKTLPPGHGVSYGHVYVTRTTERIGTVPVGYADGFRRTEGNIVLVEGHRVPVVGRVCMDQIMVQLDEAPEAAEGSEIVLLGEQRGDRISAEEIARLWGTINYEVVCGIGRRVPRVYV